MAPKTFKGHHPRAMSVGRIGDQSVGGTYVLQANGLQYTAAYVLFHRGSCAAFVSGAGLFGTFDPTTIVNLASVVDRRLQGHARHFSELPSQTA
jgi:hypothetical protein